LFDPRHANLVVIVYVVTDGGIQVLFSLGLDRADYFKFTGGALGPQDDVSLDVGRSRDVVK